MSKAEEGGRSMESQQRRSVEVEAVGVRRLTKRWSGRLRAPHSGATQQRRYMSAG